MTTTRSAAQRKRARAQRSATRPPVGAAVEPEEPLDEAPYGLATPRWPSVASLVICVLGLAVASYLTWVHYHPGLTLACPDRGVINCEAVTTSSYSSILGVPVAVLGLPFFAAMIPLSLPVAWRSPNRWLRRLRVAGTVVGMGMVLWLVYAELFLIGKICIYCTSVHVLTFALFVVVTLGTIATSPEQA